MTAGSPVIESGTSANDQGALSDVGLRLYHGFFVPGDYVSSLLSAHAPRVAQFLGLDAVGHGSVLLGLISGVVWLGAIVLIVAAGKLVRDLDRTLTAATGRLYQELRRIEGVVTRRLGIAFRSLWLKRQARLARTQVSEQGELTALELAVLQCHAGLGPGHLLTVSDIVSALNVRSTHVELALTRLKALSFIHRTFGAGDGEDGYRLTRPGELFLVAYGARPTKGQERRNTKGRPGREAAVSLRIPGR
jgi:DNA-binding MarR family transcriptional regulator